MNRLKLALYLVSTILITACQTTAHVHNGLSGYEIESKSNETAVLSYTLAETNNTRKEQLKLQHACQQVLDRTKKYQIKILSENTMVTPEVKAQQNIQIGQSKASFGLSNTQSSTSDQTIATNLALDTRPSTLKVVRYLCH